jgi:ribosomal-protein-alanine N-acetyltransferase
MSGTKRSVGNVTPPVLTLVRKPTRPRKLPVVEPVSDPALFFLRGKRLGFRIWSEMDLPLAIDLWGDPQVTKFIDVRHRLSDKDVRQLLDKQIDTQRQAGIQYWPLFLLENGEHVGCCGLRPYDSTNSIYELGVHLLPRYWGQGLAEEAASVAMEYAFRKLGASALFAGHHPDNGASRRLLGKLGFQFTHMQLYPATGVQHRSYIRTRGVKPLRFR